MDATMNVEDANAVIRSMAAGIGIHSSGVEQHKTQYIRPSLFHIRETKASQMQAVGVGHFHQPT